MNPCPKCGALNYTRYSCPACGWSDWDDSISEQEKITWLVDRCAQAACYAMDKLAQRLTGITMNAWQKEVAQLSIELYMMGYRTDGSKLD